MKPLVAILAGGASSRMGRDKARISVAGETLLERVVAIAASIGDAVVIGEPSPGASPGIADLRVGRLGPLAGLETALDHAAGRDVVLLAVDQPFVRAETLQQLLDITGDAVVPVDDGWEQVTCAVYRGSCLPAVRKALDEGERSIITVLRELDTTRVDPELWGAWGEDGRSWFSVDTPEALAEGVERFG